MIRLDQFNEIWCLDSEFRAPDGHRPEPVCLVAVELRSGRRVSLWADELSARGRPPFDTGRSSLIVAYFASAELGCFLALGWPMPANVLDLYAEFRCASNGLPTAAGRGLVGALTWYGLEAMSAAVKDANRDLVMRGGPYTGDERDRILRYCGDDVDSLVRLFRKMEPSLQPQAILRGRYMKAVAQMESNGVPIDTETLERLRDHWPDIQDELIRRVDVNYGVFDGRTFKQDRFAKWLHGQRIRWPILDSGRFALDDDTFRSMAKTYPALAPLRELRVSLSQMRLLDLAVGPDGRNRTLLSAFASKSSRNQPSNTRFVFGPATWLRGLIQPSPGRAVCNIDFEQEEFAIVAALSGDKAMMDAYLSGDPYLAFARAVGAVPANATAKTHPRQRAQFKTTVLGVQYGMTEVGLAVQLGISPAEARHLLTLHHKAFPRYWEWSEAAVNFAMLTGSIHTVFGWTLHVTPDTKPRTLANFPGQANGAEILRLACSFATERGISVCAPIHDALLIEGPADCIEDVVAETQSCMREAGEIVLNGFPLRSEANIIRYPDRYMDEKRGRAMWDAVMGIMDGQSVSADPSQGCQGTPASPGIPA
jgi:hypothetical protein